MTRLHLVRLRLVNFRNHRDTTVEFRQGVNAIVGPNGSGKSSIVEALMFLLGCSLLDSKADVIRRGSTSSWVEGELLVLGQELHIKRHVDSTKCELTYDGVTYKKVTEVKAKWDELLMLNPDIVENVLVATQGNTTALFDGDFATRLKIFQKIFVVPAVDKLRTTIWDKFIKTAPPAKPVDDESVLLTRLKEQEAEYETYRERHAAVSEALANVDVKAVQARKALAERYVREVPVLNHAKAHMVELTSRLSVLSEKLRDVGYNPKLSEQIAAALDYETSVRKLSTLKGKLVLPDPYDDSKLDECYQLRAKWKAWLEAFSLADLEEQLACCTTGCPTCKRPYDNEEDILTRKASLEREKSRRKEEEESKKRALSSVEETIERITEAKRKYDLTQQANQKIQSEITKIQGRLEGQPVPAVSHEDLESQVEENEKLEKVYLSLSGDEEEAKAELTECRVILKNADKSLLAAFESVQAAEEAVTEAEQTLDAVEVIRKDKEDSRFKLATLDAEIKHLRESLSGIKLAKEHNAKVDAYLSVLQGVYDAFHTTNFPSTLISKYTGAVCSALKTRLYKFDFPYGVTIDDQFRIKLTDDTETPLPRVSGGQKVMVGLALRLAIHDMFGEAFPLLVIDEGSVHLDETNRQVYFQLVSSLKKESGGKQIIIIDHVKELSDYVDHTINL